MHIMEGPSPDLRVEGECVIGVGVGGCSCLLSQDRPEQPGSECSLAVPPVAPERQRRTVGAQPLGSQVRIQPNFSLSSKCISWGV